MIGQAVPVVGQVADALGVGAVAVRGESVEAAVAARTAPNLAVEATSLERHRRGGRAGEKPRLRPLEVERYCEIHGGGRATPASPVDRYLDPVHRGAVRVAA